MSYNLEETVSTLRFGSRAKLIKNKPTMNAERSVVEYKRMLEVQRQQIAWQQEIIVGLEGDVDILKRFCAQHRLTVPALSGMSGGGIAIKMRNIDEVEDDRGPQPDDDDPDTESEVVTQKAVEESKEEEPSSVDASRFRSQSEISSLPSRLALLSTRVG